MDKREFKRHIQKAIVVVAREMVKLYIEESRRMDVLINEHAAELLREEQEGELRRILDEATSQNNDLLKSRGTMCSVRSHSNGALGGCPWSRRN